MLLVSICIPTYNGAKYIEAALDSVFKQTYAHIEIIVSDDDSKDATLAIVKKYQATARFPMRIFNHEPSGIGANWNNCMKHAQGDYIKFLFQDDLLEPSCLADMVAVFRNYPHLGLVCSKRHILCESEMDQDSMRDWLELYGDLQAHLKLKYQPVGLLDKTFFKSKNFYRSPINVIGEPTAVMFPSSMIDLIGYFREDMTHVLDYEYWYRILKQKSIAVIDSKLVSFRLHAEQATQKNKGNMKQDVIIFKKLLYKDYFWILNSNLQKRLFFQFHSVGKLIKKYIIK